MELQGQLPVRLFDLLVSRVPADLKDLKGVERLEVTGAGIDVPKQKEPNCPESQQDDVACVNKSKRLYMSR